MSSENAEKLVDKLRTDPGTANKIRGGVADGFQAKTREIGLECTPQEFAQALQKHVAPGASSGVAFTAADGVVSGVVGGVSSGHVSAVGSGIA